MAKPPVRLLLPGALLLVTACSGLDARQLENLHYGMPLRDVAAALDGSEGIPVMRFFAADAAGREQDVRIDFHEGSEPHPSFALVSIDGRLAAATLASGRWFLDGQWWRRPASAEKELVEPWTPQALQALVRDAVERRRLPLAWDQLEPVVSVNRQGGRYGAVAMATILVLPMVIYLPYWAWMQTFGDTGYEAAAAARTFLLDAPRAIGPEQVIAALGPPTRDREFADEGASLRVLGYDLPGNFTITVGFDGGGLLWADFGSWWDWAQAFLP